MNGIIPGSASNTSCWPGNRPNSAESIYAAAAWNAASCPIIGSATTVPEFHGASNVGFAMMQTVNGLGFAAPSLITVDTMAMFHLKLRKLLKHNCEIESEPLLPLLCCRHMGISLAPRNRNVEGTGCRTWGKSTYRGRQAKPPGESKNEIERYAKSRITEDQDSKAGQRGKHSVEKPYAPADAFDLKLKRLDLASRRSGRGDKTYRSRHERRK